jgi:hypothetical protein
LLGGKGVTRDCLIETLSRYACRAHRRWQQRYSGRSA